MRNPGTVSCDFCEKPIDTATPYTTFDVAVPKDVAEQVHEQWAKDAPKNSMFGMTFPVPMPTHYTLDVCQGCEVERLPDLRPLVAVRVITMLEKARAKAARAGATPQMKDD